MQSEVTGELLAWLEEIAEEAFWDGTSPRPDVDLFNRPQTSRGHSMESAMALFGALAQAAVTELSFAEALGADAFHVEDPDAAEP